MRKALTLTAVALTTSLALGGATTAFAAGTPTPAPSPTASTHPAASARVEVPSSPVKPGDAISVTVTAPAGSKNLAVSSAALGDVRLTPAKDGSWSGTATVADVKDGSYGVSLTGSAPDGTRLRATAQLTVHKGDAPKPPTPAPSTLRLSTDFGRPGDKVTVTVKTTAKDAYVKSAAFAGGRVDLKNDGHGTFTGTATVAKDVRTGYYGVDAFAGGKKFDTARFSTEAKGAPDVKPVPLKPSEHKTPKGSVNTGQAPADA
ncbi:hypothetical protein [Streptomyces sp. C]|uniref:hypothetical protein n=1 Tax=Streptomyces sp. C TaxID=253839 RepID=UPI0001B54D26|nr:hypothetical protein [Streptomyces sp. C]EFL16669.1 predicted protein [Streptomyces sp. C]